MSTTKRFGVRYGLTVKNKLAAIEKEQKKAYECPVCLAIKSKRVASGIWQCGKCGIKYTGGSYSPIQKVEESI